MTLLREHGYNDREIEVIVRSKWPPWAVDEGEGPNGRASADLEYVRKAGRAELANLVEEHFSFG